MSVNSHTDDHRVQRASPSQCHAVCRLPHEGIERCQGCSDMNITSGNFLTHRKTQNYPWRLSTDTKRRTKYSCSAMEQVDSLTCTVAVDKISKQIEKETQSLAYGCRRLHNFSV